MLEETSIDGGPCPTCGRSAINTLTEEEIADRLRGMESAAIEALEANLASMDERVRQAAAKMIFDFTRAKPKTTVAQTGPAAATVIVYETAVWQQTPEEVAKVESAGTT